MNPLATLLYTWDELDALAQLVDAELALSEHMWPTGDEHRAMLNSPHWAMLNSLRTSLREAQYTVRPT